jgi:hypothetical protein
MIEGGISGRVGEEVCIAWKGGKALVSWGGEELRPVGEGKATVP